jgi:hypothetical protein
VAEGTGKPADARPPLGSIASYDSLGPDVHIGWGPEPPLLTGPPVLDGPTHCCNAALQAETWGRARPLRARSGERKCSAGPGPPGRRPAPAAQQDDVYGFAQDLRVAQTGRHYNCCRKRCTPGGVQVQRDAAGRVELVGVETCGSVHACPICARKIYARRSVEVTKLVERAQAVGLVVFMVTLTIRHSGQGLAVLLKGLCAAWRYWWQGGAGALARRRDWQIRHYVRGSEQTHGRNGWHPHLHVLMAAPQGLDAQQIATADYYWRAAVQRELGPQALPEPGIGLKVTRIARDDKGSYLTKLGVEISNIGAKRAKGGHRNHWQIARDAAAGDEASQRLWREYAAATKGSRQLTWSRKTKSWAGLEDLSDEQIATERLERPDVLMIAPKTWDRIVRAGLLPVVVAIARVSLRKLVLWLDRTFQRSERPYRYHLLR